MKCRAFLSMFIQPQRLSLSLALGRESDRENCDQTARDGNTSKISALAETAAKAQQTPAKDVAEKGSAEATRVDDAMMANEKVSSRTYRRLNNSKKFKLTGTEKEQKFFHKLISSKRIIDEFEYKKIKDCKTIICATTKLYGSEESAMRALRI